LFGTIFALEKSIRRVAARSPGIENIPMAFQGALVAFAVGGTFYSECLYDLPYFLIMASAVWLRVERSTVWELPEDGTGGFQANETIAVPA
jgi:hypothetical protein